MAVETANENSSVSSSVIAYTHGTVSTQALICTTAQDRPVGAIFIWYGGERLSDVGTLEVYKHLKCARQGGGHDSRKTYLLRSLLVRSLVELASTFIG